MTAQQPNDIYRCLWTNAFLLCKPFPCSPAAETAIQSLIGSFASRFSLLYFLSRGVFFGTDTGNNTLTRLNKCAFGPSGLCHQHSTANLRTTIMDFRGFHSSLILILRGGILMFIGDFPESLSQAILVGKMLVGRLGEFPQCERRPLAPDLGHPGRSFSSRLERGQERCGPKPIRCPMSDVLYAHACHIARAHLNRPWNLAGAAARGNRLNDILPW